MTDFTKHCNFTFAHYRECLTEAKRLNCSVEWIHDVDHSVMNLLHFAKIENELDIKSTYFVRTHARTYNPFCYEVLKTLRTLVDTYGHQIGLHFEPWYYLKDDMALAINREATLLSSLVGDPVQSVSIHSPSKGGTVPETLVPSGMTYYCYDSNYYQGKKYISDSGGRWREGCMCQHLGKHERMIILTHDLWWYNEYSSESY